MPAAMLGLMVAAMAGAGQAASAENPADWALPDRVDPHAVPVEYGVVGPADFALPTGESVRAATWDELAVRPDRPVTLRLACPVMIISGAPGTCVDAALVPPGQKTLDWERIRSLDDANMQAAGAADRALRLAANLRINAALLTARPASKEMFVVKFFEEVISPADARPPFLDADAPLITGLVRKPVDSAVLINLYPTLAVRYAVAARVSMICRITDALRLLCRDPGTVEFAADPPVEVRGAIAYSLRHATYQYASVIRFEAKNKDGEDVAGRAFRVSLRWEIPQH